MGTVDQGYVAVGANASVILASFALDGSTVEPEATIVRTRGLLSVRSTSTGVDMDIIGAFGMGLVSDEAFAAGAASVPGPWTQSNWEGWFVWIPVAFRFEVTTDVGRLLSSVQMPIDSKAMRKFGAGQTMVWVYESQASAATVAILTRVLLKE